MDDENVKLPRLPSESPGDSRQAAFALTYCTRLTYDSTYICRVGHRGT